MQKSKRKANFFSITIVALLLTMIVPVTAFGDRRGRGRHRDWNDKKCEKFVNCHDARDGRWDGRGPRRRFDDSSWRRRSWRNRNWDRDRDWNWDRDRNWNWDRDRNWNWDRDRNWNDDVIFRSRSLRGRR